MDFQKATTTQLETIVKYEYTCPHSLLSGAVLEMLNRNLFDKLIAKVIRNVMNVEAVEKVHKVSFEDFMQIGRLEVLNTLKRFNPNKNNNFTSFMYLTVKQRIIKVLVYLGAEMRDSYKASSYNVKTNTGEELEIFLEDTRTNVEKYVVNKVTLEQCLNRLSDYQREVVLYRSIGYSYKELCEMFGKKHISNIQATFEHAIKKMRKGA